MVKDRLLELQTRGNLVSKPKHLPGSNNEPLIPDFFQKLERLRIQVDELECNVTKVSCIYLDVIASPTADHRLSEKAEDLSDEIKNKATNIRGQLLEYEKEIFKSELGDDPAMKALLSTSNAKERIKQHQFNTISKKFASVMLDFIKKQNEFKDSCKKQIQTNLRIAGKEYSDNELDRILESGRTHIFTDDIISQTEAAKRMLHQIEARHQDLLKLERSLVELKDIFQSVYFLIQQQGEAIDRIDIAVNLAAENTESAKSQLQKASKYRKGARRKKIICYAILAIVLLIAIISLLSSLGILKSS